MTTQNTSGSGSSQSSHSHSEVGHIKNVANFNVLVTTCQGFGASYNPTNTHITVSAIQALYNTADAAVTNSVNLGNTQQQLINARVNAFAGIKTKATRMLAALIASGADTETIKNAKTINRKIQGGRAKAIAASDDTPATGSTPNNNPSTGGTTANPAPGTEKTISTPITVQPINISVSQQSYDRYVSNFKALINYVSQVSTYHPNEADLQVAALNTYWATLQTANNGVISAHVNFSNAVITRTKVLYDYLTGLVHIALEVKQYVSSIYGAGSLQTKQVKHIKFRTLA